MYKTMYKRSILTKASRRNFSSTAYIVSAARTPVGSFQKSLASLSAPTLGSIAIRDTLFRAGIDAAAVDEVFMGNVVSANAGQAPARQAAINAGLPVSVPCTTVNKVCASGMKSITLAAQSILVGQNHCVVAGGMESMSNIPHYVANMRTGQSLGNVTMIDGLVSDGLTCSFDKHHMGLCAENTADVQGFSRADQDAYCIESYRRAQEATLAGHFKPEIVPVHIPQRRGDPIVVCEDEEWKGLKLDKVPSLKAVFKKGGTVTAANASTLNDGASAVLVCSEEFIKTHGLTPIAKIVSFADAACAPVDFPIAPSLSLPKALERGNLTVKDIDFFEVNEAFSVVALANMKLGGFSHDKTNIWGGAVSLGHPIGSSGSRIVVTLMNVLRSNGASLGAAGICNGGGGATSIIIEAC